MKRLMLTFLAVFYLGIAQGATVYFHYCMGELVEMGLSSSEKSSCAFCGMERKDAAASSCCKDEAKQAKIDQSQKTATLQFDFQQAAVLVKQPQIRPELSLPVPAELGQSALSHAPPRQQQIPVFIRNCNYRI